MDRSLSKDFHSLLKNIDKLSDGQAAVVEWDDSDLSNFVIEISPKDGLYKGGKFKFSFEMCEAESWPDCPPLINCITPIYHPNIDKLYDGDVEEEDSNICVEGIGDDWESTLNLDFCVQALLFLFYQPNLDDPLTCAFRDSMSKSSSSTDDNSGATFAENVMTSLKGGTIYNGSDEYVFKPNYGWLENFGQKTELSTDHVEEMDVSEIEVALPNEQCEGVEEDILPLQSRHDRMFQLKGKPFSLSKTDTFPNMCTVTPLQWSNSCIF